MAANNKTQMVLSRDNSIIYYRPVVACDVNSAAFNEVHLFEYLYTYKFFYLIKIVAFFHFVAPEFFPVNRPKE